MFPARTSARWFRPHPGCSGERFAKVAAVSSFVVNGERAQATDHLEPADELAILPPVSGG